MIRHNETIKIRVSQLSKGSHEYHFLSEPADLGLGENFKGKVQIDVVLDKTNNQFYLRAAIRSSGTFQCDRCIESFEHNLQTAYNKFYVFDELVAANYDPDEVEVINSDTQYIFLDNDIREMINLAVPLKLLCWENCKGLCPRCGTNWNYEQCACQQNSSDFTLGTLLNKL